MGQDGVASRPHRSPTSGTGRGRRFLVVVLAVAVTGVACGQRTDDTSPSPVEATDTVPDAADANDRTGSDGARPLDGERVVVELPPIAPIALPELSTLGAVGDVVADSLGELVAPANGVDVVAAQCREEGGELVFQGTSSGDDVFTIAEDGSGTYRQETDDGVLLLEVEPDGTGRFYQETARGLVTIDVEPDGSGRYYDNQGGRLVTVERNADGSGRLYDDRAGLHTIVRLPDGTAEYYRESRDEGLLTIAAGPDGSGQYYWRAGDELLTIDIDEDGGWVLSQTAAEYRLELTVEPDGSGHYIRTGLQPRSFPFDDQGRAAGGVTIEVPDRPVLTMAEPFPPLGKLGSLAPPCAAVIRLDASLLFEFGEAEIRSEASDTLDDVAAALIEAGKPIQVNGHTDSVGSEESNLELSRRRAEAVEAELRARGLSTPIDVNGFGESQPVAPNATDEGVDDPAGRARNRRVDIVVPETGSSQPTLG